MAHIPCYINGFPRRHAGATRDPNINKGKLLDNIAAHGYKSNVISLKRLWAGANLGSIE